MAKQKQDDQVEYTYSSYVRIRDVALKTCQRRWMIGWSGKGRSGISLLAPWWWWGWYRVQKLNMEWFKKTFFDSVFIRIQPNMCEHEKKRQRIYDLLNVETKPTKNVSKIIGVWAPSSQTLNTLIMLYGAIKKPRLSIQILVRLRVLLRKNRINC